MKEQVELNIPSILGSEKVAMEKAARVARDMGFSDDRIEDLKTAVSEACINAIEHGNKLDQNARVGIILRPEDSQLQIDIYDEGVGFSKEMPCLENKEIKSPCIEERIRTKNKSRGWGVFLIKNLMNEVKVQPSEKGGNVMTLVIHLNK